MTSDREYLSPDGLLRFQVVTGGDGDVHLGFDGYAWHTHADILAAVAGLPEADAVERFVRDLVENRAVIALSRTGGLLTDVWVTDEPASENRYLSPGESVELRYWDGRPWEGASDLSRARSALTTPYWAFSGC
jgi:hypothetical protein